MNPNQPDIADQVRVNIAFEHMIVSVLAGAFAGGALTFVLALGGALIAGAFSFSTLVSAALETLLVSFLIFLVGFFASVIIGAPLFMALEKAKRRNVWPWLAAALGVSLIALAFVSGGLPLADDLSLRGLAATILPAIVIALTFARQMRPHWRAAERAELSARNSAQNIVRLH